MYWCFKFILSADGSFWMLSIIVNLDEAYSVSCGFLPQYFTSGGSPRKFINAT